MKRNVRLKAIICVSVTMALVFSAPFCSFAAIETDSGNLSETLNPKSVLVNVKDADVRDVLSAIAVNMGYNIVYTGPATTVSLDLDNISPSAAFDYLLKTLDLTYLQEGSTLIVGDRDTLQNNFNRSLALTRFDLTYITPNVLSNMITQLRMPVTVVTLNANETSLWVQGFPTDIAKVRELVNVVDIKENKDESGADLPEERKDVKTLSYIKLNHATPYEFKMLLQTLGIDYSVSIFDDDSRLYIYATPEERRTVLDIKNVIDRSTVYYDNIDTGETVRVLMAYDPTNPKPGTKPTVAGKQTVISAISAMCPGLKVVSVDNLTAAFVVMGERAEIDRAESLIRMLNNNAKDLNTTYFTVPLKQVTAAEAERRLQGVTFGDNVVWYVTTHADFSGTIHIYCNSDYESQVKALLDKIDKEEESVASRIKNMPIYAVRGDDPDERAKYLRGIKSYLELMLNFGQFDNSGNLIPVATSGITMDNTYENIGFLYLDNSYRIEVIELVRVMIARLEEVATDSKEVNVDDISWATYRQSHLIIDPTIPENSNNASPSQLAAYAQWVIEQLRRTGANTTSFSLDSGYTSWPQDDSDDVIYMPEPLASSTRQPAPSASDNGSSQPASSGEEVFEAACAALEAAIYDGELEKKVSYETGESTIFRIAEEAVKGIPNAIVVFNANDPARKVKPTESENGSLFVSLILNVGSRQEIYDIQLTLPATPAGQP